MHTSLKPSMPLSWPHVQAPHIGSPSHSAQHKAALKMPSLLERPQLVWYSTFVSMRPHASARCASRCGPRPSSRINLVFCCAGMASRERAGKECLLVSQSTAPQGRAKSAEAVNAVPRRARPHLHPWLSTAGMASQVLVSATARESCLDARELCLDARESSLDAREFSLGIALRGVSSSPSAASAEDALAARLAPLLPIG
mmetsp:Transcript_122890/g.262225  ORF Transcript_122890/g.262225 Transcript_122890/m.262225 type:complete len:200 (-) Transcript_122890:100-699(-)